MTSGWGMVTAGLAVRSAVAMSLAPPKLLRRWGRLGGSFSLLAERTTAHTCMARGARASGGRVFSGGGPPIRQEGAAGQAAQHAGDALPSAAAKGGLRLPPRLAPPPPDFVRHAHCPRAGPLWLSVAAFLGWSEERAKELIEFGGVYFKATDAPATAKPRRELDPDRPVEIGEYLRIFPEPRRYPSFFGVDWESKIVYESSSVMLVDKPNGVPAHATVDNFGENMLAGIRGVRPGLELFLPHRLDIDTSGLVIVAKDQEALRSINDVIKGPGLSLQADDESPRARRARNKALRRAAAAVSDRAGTAGEDTGTPVAASSEATGAASVTPIEGTVTAGAITKRYRALVEVLPGSSPLRASPAPITHFQRVSRRAPKDFRRHQPQPAGNEEGESWIECRLRIASATDVFAAARAGEAPHGEGAVAGAAEGVAEGDSGGGRRNKLQEVEVELLTGRTHQIRGQLAAEGCPIYGDLLYGHFSPKTRTAEAPHAAATGTAAAAAAAAAEPLRPTGGSFILRRDSPPPLSPSQEDDGRISSWSCSPLGVDDDNRDGGSASRAAVADVVVVGASEEEHSRAAPRTVAHTQRGFVESPKMALQACHISLEFDGQSGEREQHSFTLGRETCWWVKDESCVAGGLP